MHVGMRIPGHIGKLPIEEQIAFAKEIGLDAIDLPGPDPEYKKALDEAGLLVGSFDIGGVGESLHKDESIRARGVQRIKDDLAKAAELGLKTAFICLVPADHAQSRRESFAIFIETYPEIVAFAESKGISLAMEPWPGPAPYYPTLACTPEMYRAIFEKISSPALGICYDPSHFVRIGVDYIRVLEEFGDRVRHAHGKDTEILHEGRYLYGTLRPTFGTTIGWSDGDWRYTIPGSGEVNWTKVAALLRIKGYDGVISIELEDHLYGHSLEANKEGIRKSVQHLRLAI